MAMADDADCQFEYDFVQRIMELAQEAVTGQSKYAASELLELAKFRIAIASKAPRLSSNKQGEPVQHLPAGPGAEEQRELILAQASAGHRRCQQRPAGLHWCLLKRTGGGVQAPSSRISAESQGAERSAPGQGAERLRLKGPSKVNQEGPRVFGRAVEPQSSPHHHDCSTFRALRVQTCLVLFGRVWPMVAVQKPAQPGEEVATRDRLRGVVRDMIVAHIS
jgi:hypothetical protein